MIGQALIFCGGRGTRLMPLTDTVPKPLVNIGERPIVWHIIKGLSFYGIDSFILTTGYKHEEFIKYWKNYKENSSKTFYIDMGKGVKKNLSTSDDGSDWKITINFTGLKNGTLSRLIQSERYITSDYFLVTYGDGLADIDLRRLEETFLKARKKGKLGIISIFRPQSRFGLVSLKKEDDLLVISKFLEKPIIKEHINIGFMVFSKEIFDYLKKLVIKEEDMLVFRALPKLAEDGLLGAYEHHGFWHPMDSYRDYVYLNEVWKSGKAPWKIW